MGKYPEIEIHVGLLGELLDGEKDVISRDSELARRAMKMESSVERSLGFLNHVYNKLDLTSVQLVKFRGHEQPGLGIEFQFNMSAMKSSEEFTYAAQQIIHHTVAVGTFAKPIRRALESFLKVLEEYE